MKIYIAGPMRGKPAYNFKAFDDARDFLTSIGYAPISPADIDRNTTGFDPIANPGQEWIPQNDPIENICRRDVDAVLDCDGIYMLEGWEDSSGANMEIGIAKFVNKKVFFQTDGYMPMIIKEKITEHQT